jgi:hypothetical protein
MCINILFHVNQNTYSKRIQILKLNIQFVAVYDYMVADTVLVSFLDAQV